MYLKWTSVKFNTIIELTFVVFLKFIFLDFNKALTELSLCEDYLSKR